MNSLLPSLGNALDPRGRADRRELLVIAILLLGAEAWLVLLAALTGEEWPTVAIATKVLILLVGGVTIIRRLHDCGLKAWWLPAAFLFTLIWTFAACGAAVLIGGFDVLEPGTLGYTILLGTAMLPPLAATLWLHFAPGDATANAYGPVPGDEVAPQPLPQPARIAVPDGDATLQHA